MPGYRRALKTLINNFTAFEKENVQGSFYKAFGPVQKKAIYQELFH